MRTDWNGKPYYSLDFYLRETFGRKVYKLALDGGMSCPNRDGTVGVGGCIFCSEGGSGEFAAKRAGSLKEQIESAKALVSRKIRDDQPLYIAYFQSYTNTYAPYSYLESLFSEAISFPEICALSIGTRPDCLPAETIRLLSSLNRKKPVYPLPVFEDAFRRLKEAGLPVIVHVILGLPGEIKEQMLETVQYLSNLKIDGIKLQLLHVLKGTDLLPLYEAGAFQVLSLPEYLELLGDCLRILPQETVIHRLSGDGPKRLLCAPLWSADKRMVLNSIHRYLKEQQIYQGMDVPKTAPTKTADLPSAP